MIATVAAIAFAVWTAQAAGFTGGPTLEVPPLEPVAPAAPSLVSAAAAPQTVSGAASAGEAAEPDTVSVECDDGMEMSEDERLVVATGNVKIGFQDLQLTADRVVLDYETYELLAEGHVVVVDGKERVTGERLGYNLKQRLGGLDRISFYNRPWYCRAEGIRKAGESRVVLGGSHFTTCDSEHPHYTFRARRIQIRQGNRLNAWDVVVYSAGVPVFYLPYMSRALRYKFAPLKLRWYFNPYLGWCVEPRFRLLDAGDHHAKLYVPFMSRPKRFAYGVHYEYSPLGAPLFWLYGFYLDKDILWVNRDVAKARGVPVDSYFPAEGIQVDRSERRWAMAGGFARQIGKGHFTFSSALPSDGRFYEHYGSAGRNELVNYAKRISASYSHSFTKWSFGSNVSRDWKWNGNDFYDPVTLLPSLTLSKFDALVPVLGISWGANVGITRRSDDKVVVPGARLRPLLSVGSFQAGWLTDGDRRYQTDSTGGLSMGKTVTILRHNTLTFRLGFSQSWREKNTWREGDPRTEFGDEHINKTAGWGTRQSFAGIWHWQMVKLKKGNVSVSNDLSWNYDRELNPRRVRNPDGTLQAGVRASGGTLRNDVSSSFQASLGRKFEFRLHGLSYDLMGPHDPGNRFSIKQKGADIDVDWSPRKPRMDHTAMQRLPQSLRATTSFGRETGDFKSLSFGASYGLYERVTPLQPLDRPVRLTGSLTAVDTTASWTGKMGWYNFALTGSFSNGSPARGENGNRRDLYRSGFRRWYHLETRTQADGSLRTEKMPHSAFLTGVDCTVTVIPNWHVTFSNDFNWLNEWGADRQGTYRHLKAKSVYTGWSIVHDLHCWSVTLHWNNVRGCGSTLGCYSFFGTLTLKDFPQANVPFSRKGSSVGRQIMGVGALNAYTQGNQIFGGFGGK